MTESTDEDRKSKVTLSPETLSELERHCSELFATYHRAMEAAKVLEQKARAARLEWARVRGETLSNLLRGDEPSPNAKKIREAALAERDRYERNRAKFRGKANQLRRRAETILAVLEWAAPDKRRDERLRWQRDRRQSEERPLRRRQLGAVIGARK
jgi:hypothetical protein